MVAVAVAAAGLAAGCYDPSPQSGSYTCGADNACPAGQHCICGLCVDRDDQAACSFRVTASPVADALACPASTGAQAAATIRIANEHQPFPLTVEALKKDGTPAAGYRGTVALSAVSLNQPWGDVSPPTVTLSGGMATAMVSVNREVTPPQTIRIDAAAGAARGSSNRLCVQAPPFVRDASATIPPASVATPFGWADAVVAEPFVVRVPAGGYRMYFAGASIAKSAGIGVATSSDGRSFSPTAMPVLLPGGAPFDMQEATSPAVFPTGNGTEMQLVFAGKDKAGPFGAGEIGLARSPDGLAGFTLIGAGALIRRTDCVYCTGGLDFPTVIPDPSAEDGKGWLMFFSATKSGSVGIGRAESTDGTHFAPEPGAVLSGDFGGEAILLSPRVLVDGSVFKMWYTFARLADVKNLADFCDSANKVQIGYATSADGLYWVRSPSNPVLSVGGAAWDAASRVLLVGSVLPATGDDAGSGVVLYYSTFTKLAISSCLPNGVGRAVRR